MKWLSSLKLIASMGCRESARLLSLQQDTELRRDEKIALSLHLFMCKACRRYKKQLAFFCTCFVRFRRQINSLTMSSKAKDAIRDKLKDSFEK